MIFLIYVRVLANWCIQQMIRYVVLQYRDDLLTLQEEVAAQARQRSMSESRSTPRRQSSSQRRVELSRALFSDEEKDQVASDLLAVLQMIPIQVIGEFDDSGFRDSVRGCADRADSCE